MRSLLRLILWFAVIFPLLGHAAVIAEEDLRNDALLDQASRDIREMKSNELEVFLTYLASCSDNLPYRYKQSGCNRDRTLYQIKYARGRALDRVISARTRMDRDLDQAIESVNPAVTELYLSVGRRLTEVARARFRAISK